VTTSELSIHSRKLPVADALRERNDSPDPTGEDIWPLDRDQCPDCRCAPNMVHSPECDVSSNPVVSCDRKDDTTGCDCATKVTDSVINAVPEHYDGVRFGRETPTKLPVDAQNEHPAYVCSDCGQDRYGPPIAISTWHNGKCGICGLTTAVTETRDFGGYHKWSAANLYEGDSLCTVTAPETTSPADSWDEKCPVCLQKTDDGETILCDHCEESIGVESFAVVRGPGGVFVYHLPCYDEVYWAAQGVGHGHRAGQNTEDVEETHEHLQGEDPDRMSDTIDDNPLLNHMECTFNSCMDIAVAKNEGYAGSADPMANFNDSVRLGVPVPIGVALRMSDKWARLCRLLQTGENPLADESITDTIMDAVNYLAILLYALENEGSSRR